MAREGQPLSPHCGRMTYDSALGQATRRCNSVAAPWAQAQILSGLLWLPGKGQAQACGSALCGLKGAAGGARVWQQRAL